MEGLDNGVMSRPNETSLDLGLGSGMAMLR